MLEPRGITEAIQSLAGEPPYKDKQQGLIKGREKHWHVTPSYYSDVECDSGTESSYHQCMLCLLMCMVGLEEKTSFKSMQR
jgi:hypothetical protein